jgi:hypothetical protein
MGSRSHPLSVTALCLALTLGAVTGCTMVPPAAPPRTAAGPTPEQSRAAIIQALATHEYIVDEESPGRIRASMLRDSWTMVIEVFYDKDISVHYADSRNLDYEVRNDVAYIHRNFNVRADELLVEIQRRLVVVALEYCGLPAPPTPQPGPPTH